MINQRLAEQRQALTTLRSFRRGQVGSVRTIADENAGVLPSAAPNPSRSNVPVPVYHDQGVGAGLGAEAAAPVSILSVAKLQTIRKEDVIKPGAWTGPGNLFNTARGGGVAVQRIPTFTSKLVDV